MRPVSSLLTSITSRTDRGRTSVSATIVLFRQAPHCRSSRNSGPGATPVISRVIACPRAKRLKRSKSSLVEELAEKGAKVRRFPGIAFRGEGPYRDPWIVGTGLDVWELCEILEPA